MLFKPNRNRPKPEVKISTYTCAIISTSENREKKTLTAPSTAHFASGKTSADCAASCGCKHNSRRECVHITKYQIPPTKTNQNHQTYPVCPSMYPWSSSTYSGQTPTGGQSRVNTTPSHAQAPLINNPLMPHAPRPPPSPPPLTVCYCYLSTYLSIYRFRFHTKQT